MSGTILVERHGAALHLVFSHEAKRNALSREMLERLIEEVARIRSEPSVKLVIVRGAGAKAFCAGGDLDAMAEGAAASFGAMETALDAAMAAIQSLPVPVIAAIDGACFGAGVQMALAADIRLATERSRFGIPAIRLGFVYPPMAIKKLAELMGSGRAGRLLLTGETLSATDAFALGLVERVVADDALHGALAEITAVLEVAPAAAVQAYIRMLRMASGGAALDDLQAIQAAVHRTDYLEERLRLIGANRRDKPSAA